MCNVSLARNGVVIATDKKVASVLVDSSEFAKIQSITPNTGIYSRFVYQLFGNTCCVGVIYSGMGPDYRVLVRAARKEAQVQYTYII